MDFGHPRRINLLCSRILLSTFLAGGDEITAAAVARIAMESGRNRRGFAGGYSGPSTVRPCRLIAPFSKTQTGPALEIPTLTHSSVGRCPASSRACVQRPGLPFGLCRWFGTQPYFLLISGSMSGILRAAALQRAFATREGMRTQVLHIDCPGRFELTGRLG